MRKIGSRRHVSGLFAIRCTFHGYQQERCWIMKRMHLLVIVSALDSQAFSLSIFSPMRTHNRFFPQQKHVQHSMNNYNRKHLSIARNELWYRSESHTGEEDIWCNIEGTPWRKVWKPRFQGVTATDCEVRGIPWSVLIFLRFRSCFSSGTWSTSFIRKWKNFRDTSFTEFTMAVTQSFFFFFSNFCSCKEFLARPMLHYATNVCSFAVRESGEDAMEKSTRNVKDDRRALVRALQMGL